MRRAGRTRLFHVQYALPHDAILELEARIANPRHWSKEENEQNIEKLRHLTFQKQLLIDYEQK